MSYPQATHITSHAKRRGTGHARPSVTGLLSMLCALLAAPSALADWLYGGTSDIDTGGFGAVVEYHWAPSDSVGQLDYGPAIAMRSDRDGDQWMGGGVAATYRMAPEWVFEASFMPGLYHAGQTDLGGALEFRTKIGIGYQVSPGIALSLSIDHMSNGGLRPKNPGSDAVTIGIRLL